MTKNDLERLRALCFPTAEAFGDFERISGFCELGSKAVDEINRLRDALKLAEYMSRKDSLCDAERLEGARAVLTRAIENTP